MLGVGCGLYLVGVARPEVNIDLNIFDAIGVQKKHPRREFRLHQLQA
jgi:hypothetical protein